MDQYLLHLSLISTSMFLRSVHPYVSKDCELVFPVSCPSEAENTEVWALMMCLVRRRRGMVNSLKPRSLCYKECSCMPASNKVVNNDFRTWLPIGWQLCCQPIRSYVWKFLLPHWTRWILSLYQVMACCHLSHYLNHWWPISGIPCCVGNLHRVVGNLEWVDAAAKHQLHSSLFFTFFHLINPLKNIKKFDFSHPD